MTDCKKFSEVFVNGRVAVMKCFTCHFTQEIGPGADIELIVEIERVEHRSGRWKRVK